jgi:hypothetical protein
MAEGPQEIAMRLGTGFAAIALKFLPAVEEAVRRSGKEISFGATCKIKRDRGVLVGKLVPHEPKIPTEGMDAIHFVLQVDATGQLEFMYAGTLQELKAEAAAEAASHQPDDGYTPGENVHTDDEE